jgi:glycosyltransferase involved in cell wall biosynthesis
LALSEELKGTPLVSVVIPTYNEQDQIRRCLTSIFAQQTSHSFEVIVVDSSRDDTPDIVRREFPDVNLIHREQQTFAAEARNIGIEQASGTIVAFIDADCVADIHWISAIAGLEGCDHPAVGGAISLNSPTTIAGAALFGVEFSEYGPGSPGRKIRWLPSCNLAVKRSALQQHGVFPTHMQASEDMLFTRQLMQRSGKSLRFDPQMRIRHSNRNNLAELRDKLATLGYWSGRSRATGLIPGGFLLRYPLAIPLLVPYRLIHIVTRLTLHSRDARLVAMALLGWPLMAYALAGWARAFYRGVRSVSEETE